MAQELSDDDWENLLARNSTGQIYGVRTTRIICRFGCASRPPRRENAMLITDLDEARATGFRPCKRCWTEVRKAQE